MTQISTHFAMGDQANPAQTSIPSIKITLTTFIDDKNGDVACSMRGTVKIDGEEEGGPKEVILNRTLFKYAIIKNFFVLSFGQFLLFMAFDSLSNLQSTINDQEGIGPISLAVAYGGFTISSLFLPPVIIKTWGCKKTMVITAFCFCPYILANIYPTWSTLIPSAFVCGLASGPLWCARSTYLNQISHKYAKVQRISLGIVNAWVFSFCTVFRQNTEIWGNLISHYTLKLSRENDSFAEKSSMEGSCGPDFCDYETMSTNHSFSLPSEDRRYILVVIFTVLALVSALLMSFFLDPLDSGDNGVGKHTFSSSDLLVTLYQLIQTDQLLLLPLSLYTGLVDGFYSGDYKKAYVACAWGVPHVSVVSICYGVISSLMDSACGPCVLVLGRAGLFLLAASAHFSMFVAMLLWSPDPDHTGGFYLVAGAHGIGNGVWMSQVVALYGVLFKADEEVGFSCHYFLNSLGYLLSYSYSKHLCTRAKLYIPLVMLIVGMASFFAVEVRLFKRTLVEYSLRNKHRRVFD